jgi:hypothetical protein
VLCFGAVVLPISAYLGAAVEALYVLPTELCGSDYEATCQSVYLSAGIERYDTKGFAERKSLETLVSKPTFGFFCLATKETAATRSGSPVPPQAAREAKQKSPHIPPPQSGQNFSALFPAVPLPKRRNYDKIL